MAILRVQDTDGNWIDIPAIAGAQGPQGEPGKTPEKGVDYFTETDKAEIAQAVLSEFPKIVEQATPEITVSSDGLVTASTTQAEGYVFAGTKSATKQLTTQEAQTITPGTSNKYIDSGRYLAGTQTIKGDSNLVAGNIKKGVSIFGVTGTHEGAGLPSGISALSRVAFVPTSSAMNASVTVTHNLGVIPDFYIVYGGDVGNDYATVGFEFRESILGGTAGYSVAAKFEGSVIVTSGHIRGDLYSATATSITLTPATNSQWVVNSTYYLIAGKLA